MQVSSTGTLSIAIRGIYKILAIINQNVIVSDAKCLVGRGALENPEAVAAWADEMVSTHDVVVEVSIKMIQKILYLFRASLMVLIGRSKFITGN